MVMTCAICHRIYNKLSDISFHSLPHDSTHRNSWLQACGIRQTSQNMRICSSHFLPDSFVLRVKPGPKRLKPTAVPTLYLDITDRRKKPMLKSNTEQSFCSNKNYSLPISRLSPKTPFHLLDHDYSSHTFLENVVSNISIGKEEIVSSTDDYAQESQAEIIYASKKVNAPLQNRYQLRYDKIPAEAIDDSSSESTNVDSIESIPCHIIKKSDPLKSVEFNSGSSELAMESLYMARKKISKQRKKIKVLKAENLKLSERVKTLQELLQHSIVITTPSKGS